MRGHQGTSSHKPYYNDNYTPHLAITIATGHARQPGVGWAAAQPGGQVGQRTAAWERVSWF